MRRIAAEIGNAPEDVRFRGFEVDSDSWRHDASGALYYDIYVTGSDPKTLANLFAELGARDPSLKLAADQRLLVEPLSAGSFRTYVATRRAAMTNADIATATAEISEFSNMPEVHVEFADQGAATFANLTERIKGHKLAIVFDGLVQSAPTVQTRIEGGSTWISTGTTTSEAEGLAAALRGEPLAWPLVRTDVIEIPKSLGCSRARLARAILAFGLGLFVFLLVLAVSRLAPPRFSGVSQSEAREPSIWVRVLVALGGATLSALALRVMLPVSHPDLDLATDLLGGKLSVVALGLAPVF